MLANPTLYHGFETLLASDEARWQAVDRRDVRADGLFYFQEFSDAAPDDPEYGPAVNTTPGLRSGTYKSFEAAESDLIKMTPWLCAKAR